MREMFEAWFKNQPLPTNGTVTPQGEVGYAQEALEWAFQAACNMFLPFVKIVKDSDKVKEGDLVYKFYSKKEGGGSNHWQAVADPLRDSECCIESAESLVKVDRFNIIRNGKFCIRESDLIKGGK